MLFSPVVYESVQLMKADCIHHSANSDTIINQKDVFGYVGDDAYEAVLQYCPVAADDYWVAGEKIA